MAERGDNRGLKECLGREYFEDVISLHLAAGMQMTDDDFAMLADLPGLVDLNLYATGISDAQLQYLAKLEHLQFLVISGTNVKGRGYQDSR